ncbi:MAG: hypothetical protein ACRDJ3_05260 [Solirubrobacteraceae bacterium]
MIDDPAPDSLALAGAFFFVPPVGVSVVGVVVVGAVDVPVPEPPTEITCAGATFEDPAPARPINTPIPIASSNTPTPASKANVLLGLCPPDCPNAAPGGPLDGPPGMPGGGVCGEGGEDGDGGCGRPLTPPPPIGPRMCARGVPHCKQ